MIVYRVVSVTPASLPTPFSVNSSTGAISTEILLDREVVTEYSITIEVRKFS